MRFQSKVRLRSRYSWSIFVATRLGNVASAHHRPEDKSRISSTLYHSDQSLSSARFEKERLVPNHLSHRCLLIPECTQQCLLLGAEWKSLSP